MLSLKSIYDNLMVMIMTKWIQKTKQENPKKTVFVVKKECEKSFEILC